MRCAVWKSSSLQQLMLAQSSDVIVEAIKPRTIDPNAHVGYPSERESRNDESDVSEADKEPNNDLNLK